MRRALKVAPVPPGSPASRRKVDGLARADLPVGMIVVQVDTLIGTP